MKRGGFYKRYPKDFQDGCYGLTLELRGLYNMILDEIYMTGGPVLIDLKAIGRLARSNVRTTRRLLGELVDLGKLYRTADGRIGNARADKEMGIEPGHQADLFHVTMPRNTSLAKDSPKIRERFAKHEQKSPESLADSVENTPINSTPPHTPASAQEETPETPETPELARFARKTSARATPPSAENDPSRKFPLWWDAWPHKVGKPRALQAFPAALQNAGSLSTLIDAAHRYAREKPPDRQWLNPATWLTEQRWLDQPALAPVPKATGPPGEAFADDGGTAFLEKFVNEQRKRG